MTLLLVTKSSLHGGCAGVSGAGAGAADVPPVAVSVHFRGWCAIASATRAVSALHR